MPRLADVRTLALVLEDLGLATSRGPTASCGWKRSTRGRSAPAGGWVRRMRAGFCVLGPLLARRGRAIVPLPGGCHIGDRPVDLHLKGLAALGADLRLERGYVVARARRLVGTTIDLGGPRGPTVTGTANVLSAAVLARGTTSIRGAAREPEIVDLGNFLNCHGGADRRPGHLDRSKSSGVDGLGGTTYRVIADRIEAATLLLAAAITGGEPR